MRWLVYLRADNDVLQALGVFTAAPAGSPGGPWLPGSLVFVSPPGRIAISVARPGYCCATWSPVYHVQGKVHLRLWLAQQIADLADPVSWQAPT